MSAKHGHFLLIYFFFEKMFATKLTIVLIVPVLPYIGNYFITPTNF